MPRNIPARVPFPNWTQERRDEALGTLDAIASMVDFGEGDRENILRLAPELRAGSDLTGVLAALDRMTKDVPDAFGRRQFGRGGRGQMRLRHALGLLRNFIANPDAATVSGDGEAQ